MKMRIHIPAEAQVMSIPLQSLPNVVLKRIGISVSDCDSSRNLTDSARVVWICPVVVQTADGSASSSEKDKTENVSLVMARKFKAQPGPHHVLFASASVTACNVLKNMQASDTLQLPQGSVSPTNQDAVVIFQGLLYLIFRSHHRSRGRAKKRQCQPASRATPTVSLPPKIQKKERGHASFKVTHSGIKDEDPCECPDSQPTDSVHSGDGCVSAAFSSQEMDDFSRLETEEMIAEKKAKLRQTEVDLPVP